MRIVRTRYKVLFLAAGFGLDYVVGAALGAVDRSGILAALYSLVANAWLVLAVRIFRVPEEDIRAPRPWWRLTGRPTAGFWLAGLNLFGAVGSLVKILLPPSAPSALASTAAERLPVFVVLQTAVALAWAVLYFRSSLRLARKDGPAVDYPLDPPSGYV